MNRIRSGVHTVEIQTPKPIPFDQLSEEYRAAIKPEGTCRYRVNVARLPGMDEYNGVRETQTAIDEALSTVKEIGAGHGKVTRIDYRFDDHVHEYVHNLPVMTVVVYLLAYTGGIFDRRIIYTDGERRITSVRAMPDKDDHFALYGVEYYDKENQKKTRQYGRARLELRRLNLQGESVAGVVKEWRDKLSAINRETYRNMLSERADILLSRSRDIRSIRPQLIAREEEGILLRKIGTTQNHYYCQHLPRWADVKAAIDEVTNCLNPPNPVKKFL